jgi:NADPH-dependent glutamate synthase beta subunit-like oxidoreductase
MVSGGGNMAVDAAMTALRQGAAKVVVLALESEGELPAYEAEVQQAMAEGVVFKHCCGIDRIDGKDGKLSGVVLSSCVAVFDENGKFAPRFSTERESLSAEYLVTAIGLDCEQELLEGSGLSLADVHEADDLTLQCAGGKIFVAGDYRGAGSVIKAMSMGREAAVSAHRYAMGEHLRFERGYPGPVLTDFPIKHIADANAKPELPRLATMKGKGDYSVVEQPFTEKHAQAEAARCHSCGGALGKNRTCWFCLPCEVDCPEKAIWVEIPYLIR